MISNSIDEERGTLPRNTKQQIKHQSIPVTNLEAGVIGWDDQDDVEMPMNFKKSTKLMMVVLVGSFAFVAPFASSVLVSAQTQMLQDLGSGHLDNDQKDRLLVTLAVAIYILGFAVGPLVLSPLSETHGRRPFILLSNLIFTVFSVASGLAKSLWSLIIFRFLEGIGGSGCLVIFADLLGDMFEPHERGRAMARFQLGPMTAPFVAPIVGGYITQTTGWRWCFWLCTIIGGILTALTAVGLRESNARVLIRRKARRMRIELGRQDLSSCYAEDDLAWRNPGKFLLKGLTRPLKMLFLFPVILFLSVAGAILYGLQYLLLVTLSPVFEKAYGFSAGTTGLVYISMGIGGFIGLAIFHALSDKQIVRQTSKNGGKFIPESRVALAIWGFALLPATFFIYGWCAQSKTHWIVPILALIPFGCGFTLLAMPLTTYVIDCYPVYAASAMAANMALKSVCGAFLPLVGETVYQRLGVGWGNTMLGFLALAMIPVPVIVWKFGAFLKRNDAVITL